MKFPPEREKNKEAGGGGGGLTGPLLVNYAFLISIWIFFLNLPQHFHLSFFLEGSKFVYVYLLQCITTGYNRLELLSTYLEENLLVKEGSSVTLSQDYFEE